jgi:hypothetical protein
MIQGQNVGKARIIGYAIGIAVFAAIAAWKLIVR